MYPSLIEIGSKTAEKKSAQTSRQTNRQTDKQTDTTKIMVTWPWTNTIFGLYTCNLHAAKIHCNEPLHTEVCFKYSYIPWFTFICYLSTGYCKAS